MLSKLIPWIVIIPEYQRVAVFRLGRITGYRGPGLVWRMPLIEEFHIVDNRIVTVDVPAQECITRDNIPVTVNAVVYYQVEHPDQAIVEVEDYHHSTVELAQTSLRSVIGQRSLDELLSEIDALAEDLKEIVDEATDQWGVDVSRTEIRDIEIPDEMREAMAKQAEAERERRAMRIRARGEKEASAELVEAAKELEQAKYGFQMRYLQTLLRVSEEGSTVVFASDGTEDDEAAMAAANYHQREGGEGE